MKIWYFLANTEEVSSNISKIVNDGLKIITDFYSEYKSIIIQLCATLLLFLIVRFFFWNKITAVLKQKEQNEKDAFKALDDAKKESEEIKKQIQVDLENAKQEGYQTIERAKQKAYLEAEEIVKKAKIDAMSVVKILANRKPMVWLDVEDDCQKNLGQVLVYIIQAYKKKIEDSGCPFGVYTGLSFYNNYIKPYANDLKDVPFWIARYPSTTPITVKSFVNPLKKPSIKHALYGWQYSSKCKINGVIGNVDINEWYSGVEASSGFVYNNTKYTFQNISYGDSGKQVQVLQTLLLHNNFKTAIVEEKGKQVRKELKDDGKFGPITLSALKRFQSYVGLEPTGICDTVTWMKLLEA